MIPNIPIKINASLYLKEPESSELGKNILAAGIDLLDEIGYDEFNFKKLASRIQSTEASVYRYFENKQQFLLYLTSWYWTYLEYELIFATANINAPSDKLNRSIDVLTQSGNTQKKYGLIDLAKLNRIIIHESAKTYLSKDVDTLNKNAEAYAVYKRVVGFVSEIILEKNPRFKYPHMLVTTVIEGSHLQRFFADHLPRLTDQLDGEDSPQKFYKELVEKALAT